MLPEHTSASQLSTYASCPRKYAYRYLEHADPEDRSPALVLGSVVHSAIGWFFAEKMVGCLPTVEQAKDIVVADFAAAIDGPPIRWGRWTARDLREHAQRLVGYFLVLHQDLPVVGVERRFDVNLSDPDTASFRPLRGYLDFTLADGTAIELKTARSEYGEVALASSFQFAAYAASLRQLELTELHVWVLVKRKVPALQKLRVMHPQREAWFRRAMASIEGAIAAGYFHPAPGFACASCEYRTRCLGLREGIVDKAA